MPASTKLPPQVDADLPPLYDENSGMMRRSKLNEQDHEQSGNLPPSSDPVHDDTPHRITYK